MIAKHRAARYEKFTEIMINDQLLCLFLFTALFFY